MDATKQQDDPLFWKLQDTEPTYWDEYIATRPLYDENIFRRVYDYHASHSGLRTTALDIGEDLLQHQSPGSFDLITCAETFPLMDTQIALDNIFTLLQPGGTLAIWFYGPPFFTEPDVAPTCQPIFDSIMDHNFCPVVSGGGEARRASWKRAADGMFSWLDYIPFSPNQWRDVRRHKWNPHARLSFFSHHACDFPIELTNSVAQDEVVSQTHDPSFWETSWDVSMLRKFVKASFPKPVELDGLDEEIERLFEKLAEAMGGDEVKRLLSWPAVLILAGKAEEI
ncbi:S-adenosyl-L-methionine-dependent methyltransferase [Xylaria longipes]|nr:S-adenosyl-L-methionine-dependent methyltransferase [Xylaria longipes]